MGEAAIKIEFNSSENPDAGKKVKERVSGTHTEEIIIGLCAPIGTNVHYVAAEIGRTMEEKYGYEYQIIRLSDFIRKYSKGPVDENAEGFKKFSQLIELGNELRSSKGESILAELAISEIALKREIKQPSDAKDYKSTRICYIIDSIKHQEELELFRLIYHDLFYFFGVFSIPEVREKNLEGFNLKKDEVYQLMNRDSGEELQFGQKVSDTFIQADFFLRIDQTTTTIPARISRFLSLIFSSEVTTPTTHETAMYMASAASGNSACLSRQVGASITDDKGELISIGWNDVPKVNGGVYQALEGDKDDLRCINLEGGKCFNDDEKRLIRTQLINELVEKNIISPDKKEAAVNVIKSSRIKELIEFSRAVHAEMLAIIHGCQKAGDRVRNGRLYTTTYPCHNCARHIVAAGIKEVYYIEPYRKSLAVKLHHDSLTEDEAVRDKVRILMFDGVAPRRYLDFFKAVGARKKDGVMERKDKKAMFPKATLSLQAIPILEKKVVESLKEKDVIAIADEKETG
jgi:deoxycytidylate deaminase